MSEKTEQPTHKKLREAREEGNVAKSKDFTQAALLLALFGYLVANGQAVVTSLARLMLLPLQTRGLAFEDAADTLIDALWREAIDLLWPVLLLVLVVGVAAEMLQTGVVLAFKGLKPSARKLNPATNLKQMLGARGWIELLKNVLKVAILGAIVTLLLRGELDQLLALPRAGIVGVGTAIGELVAALFKQMAVAYLAIAAADLVYQRFHHRKELMMSKDEVKREYREMEGNPEIKQQRRHLHQELQQQGAVAAARRATVVVTNPTHLAVALRYEDPESTPLPVITGRGEGALAHAMVAAAREAGVPVMQNIPLARALMARGELAQYIPTDLVEPVAELLRALQELPR